MFKINHMYFYLIIYDSYNFIKHVSNKVIVHMQKWRYDA